MAPFRRSLRTAILRSRLGALRQPRADGERARSAILRAAADLATVDGLEGLSIGNLAAATGISKSGLYAHFGSKQELQLARSSASGWDWTTAATPAEADAAPRGRPRS
jgi:hypothetical protein